MHRPDNLKPTSKRQGPANSLTDEDITTVRVDRRSFLSRTVAAGSLAVGAAMATGCPGGTDGTDSDSESEATDSESESQPTDSDSQ